MAPIRSGIPTTYAYGNMRSRLEARWAAFFDLIGWSWVYEPLDCDGYIPDFLIQGDRPMFIEVGPCITKADYQEKSAKAERVANQLRHDVLVVGVTPLPEMASDGGWMPVAGLLGEFYAHDPDGCAITRGYGIDQSPCEQHSDEFTFSTAHWHTCTPDNGRCGRISVHHGVQSYASRSCGHHDGDHHLGHLDVDLLTRYWAEAGNAVQWHAAR